MNAPPKPAPEAVAAERALLGGLMLDSDRAAEVRDLLVPADFYRPAHARLYSLLLGMVDEGNAVDLETVCYRLTREGREGEVDGLAYVVGLPDYAPATTNLRHYAGIVADASRRRSVHFALVRAQERLAEGAEWGAVADDTRAALSGLERAETQRTWRTMGECMEQAARDSDEVRAAREQGVDSDLAGCPVFHAQLAKVLNPWVPNDCTITGARPGMGKTAFLHHVVRHGAGWGFGQLVLSFEMDGTDLGRRALVSEGLDCTEEDVRQGRANWAAMMAELEYTRDLPIYVEDRLPRTVEAAARAIHFHARRHRIFQVNLDYMQLLRTVGNRDEALGAAGEYLHETCKGLGLHLHLLSQLNRGVESRPDKRPTLHDLRESGRLENFAQRVLFLYRDERYNKDPRNPLRGSMEGIVAKQRGGEEGRAWMRWNGARVRIEEPSVRELVQWEQRG